MLPFAKIVVLLFFLTTAFCSCAQTKKTMPTHDYKNAWQQVTDFESKGLPESALKTVDEIYRQAKAESNDAQLVKAVIHQFKFKDQKEENPFVLNINALQKEIAAARFPVKPVLHSMLAEMYWSYYQNNRWKFASRTETAGLENDDIETWSLEKIVQETFEHYQLSLQDAAKAKQLDIGVYQEILQYGNKKGRELCPTLYDFLAHRALDFYTGDEPQLTKPAYTFTLNSADYLGDAETFAKLTLASKDSLSMKFHALRLFQELIRNSPPSGVGGGVLDLQRLAFVREHLTLGNKNDLYLAALQKLEQKTLAQPVSTLVAYAIAQVWVEKGNLYKPLQSAEHQFGLQKAHEICEAAKKRFPESEGAVLCDNLQVSLEQKTVSSKIEKTNVPNQPFRAWVEYKNFTGLHWRIIKVTREEVRNQRMKWRNNYKVDQEQKFIEWFAAKTPLKTGKATLPDDKDYQQHSVEIKLDGVPEGDYMVLFSGTHDFKTDKNGLAYGFTTVSNLSYIHRNLDNGSTEFYVLHRQTGEPMAGVQAQVSVHRYNAKAGDYFFQAEKTYTSDAKGRFVIPLNNEQNHDNRDFSVDFAYKADKLSMRDIDDQNYHGTLYQSARQPAKMHLQTFFFLDRAIYRPGQTLYFKGLVFETDGKTSAIKPKHRTTVALYDVNGQQVARQEMTANEYGTFSGTFTTPSTGLLGQMRLQTLADNGQVSFSVEEYKRPKFEVKLNPVKGSFRLGETIDAEGVAQAYSGANIDGAQVKYRVVRTARFPMWWWYWRGYYPTSPAMEITSGVTETDANGKFQVKFPAIADETVDKTSDPVFDYQVFADVTDINGETHSSQMTVSVGYKSLVVSAEVKDIDLAATKDPTPGPSPAGRGVFVRTTNLAGQPETARGNSILWKLKTPARTFRERLWQQPDKQLFTQEEFYKLFPHDLYADENNALKWEREKEMYNAPFATEASADGKIELNVPLQSLPAGKYLLEVTAKDKFGQDAKEVAYFTVFDSKSKSLALPELLSFKNLKPTCEPGEKAEILFGTTVANAKILYEVEQDGKILAQDWLTLNNEQCRFEIPIKEEYRGNIAVHFTFIKDSRRYDTSAVIAVPYTNKQLDVQFETFRDKLQPGQQEQWKLKITGRKADKLAAEMVATLYDASLDAFRMHNWQASFYNSVYARLGWESENGFGADELTGFQRDWSRNDTKSYEGAQFAGLNWFGYEFGRSGKILMLRGAAMEITSRDMMKSSARKKEAKGDDAEGESQLQEVVAAAPKISTVKSVEMQVEQSEEKPVDFSNVKVRSNFNETAFFEPHLQTNEKGEIIINFTIPEALTRWKMLGFAHTKELQSGSVIKELVTQKDLMVVPNQPRFFREGDRMQFAVKITSLADKDLTGQAQLEFFDALTMQRLNLTPGPSPAERGEKKGDKTPLPHGEGLGVGFSLKPRQSTNLEWSIAIPEGIQAISYKIVAKAGDFSDGETMILPVVTNRMLVTETLPLPIRGKQTKEFVLEKLKNSTSKTLKTHRLTLEFSSNPAWYAVQSLPYLMEYPYDCVEQTFSRFYANSIAAHIANANPKIKRVFEIWKNYQPDALLSNLEKNQELKTALLEETPWVLNAKDETQRKRNVALLFDLNRMASEQERALDKIMKAQLSSGGFAWFPGLREDRYMTQHITAGMGHLDVLGVKSIREDARTWQMLQRSLRYLDAMVNDDYQRLKAEAKKGRIKLEDKHIGYFEIHYLYTRSYFKDVDNPHKEAFNYYLGQAKKYWLQRGIYAEGMVALALHRFGEKTIPQSIIKSLSERALHSDEMGMYWKTERGWFWYQAPVETQALLIDVYDEVANDLKSVEELKVWLLKQKQTQDWKTTKATAEACYALLRRGTDALTNDQLVEITVGNEKINPLQREDTKVEAGTGYFKTAWTAAEVKPEMGRITVTKPTDGVAWGAVYWQYFEQLDKITAAETPLKLKKQLFLEQNTDRGPVITPVDGKTTLQTGDLVKVRIELRVDRDMEYVHLKDMRAAGFEPISTLSQSKYQDGLWYYESPRDLATNFFMGYLPKGTYVFEYPLRVSQKGDFSNGITTIQCMYAPEFSSHSEGVRVKMGK